MRRRLIAVVLGPALVGVGLVGLVSPPAVATGPAATMRRLAGAIPSPFRTAALRPVKVAGNLYITDTTALYRIEEATGEPELFAGDKYTSGAADGTGTGARFDSLGDVTSDGASLYVADRGNHTIRKIVIATRAVTTVAGAAGQPGSADGASGTARFNAPSGVALSGGDLFISDTSNHTIRRLSPATSQVTTVAGSAGVSGHEDGVGAAARFSSPGVVVTSAGVLHVSESPRIRRVSIATAAVTTMTNVGPGADLAVTTNGDTLYTTSQEQDDDGFLFSRLLRVDTGTGAVSSIDPSPYVPMFGVTLADGRLYVAGGDEYYLPGIAVSRIAPDTGAAAIVGDIGVPGTVDGVGRAARFNVAGSFSGYLTTDGSQLYVTQHFPPAIRKVDIATGTVTTLPTTGLNQLSGVVRFGGHLYVADRNTLKKVDIVTGAATSVATPFPLKAITDVTTDDTSLYLSHEACAVYRVDPTTGGVSVLAGVPNTCGTQDGTGSAARFLQIDGITTDGTNLFVADRSGRVRKIVIATGQVSTLASITAVSRVTTDGTHVYAVGVTGFPSVTKISVATGAATVITGTGALGYSPRSASSTFPSALGLAVSADGRRLFFTDPTGVGVIEDPTPQLSIGDVTISEGNGGTGPAVFTVRLSSPQPRSVTVGFLTNDGAATAGSGDYVGQSGRLTFPPGVVEQRVRVTVNGDATDEANESFKVRLVWPVGGAAVGRAIGTATVLDDDPGGGGATLALGDASIVEGDDLSALAIFPVRLSSAQAGQVSVSFATGDFNATAASGDYDARTGTLTLAPGVTGATIFVKVNGDDEPEALEAFVLTTSGSSGPTITRATGTGGIINDD